MINQFLVNVDACNQAGVSVEQFLYLMSLYLEKNITGSTIDDCVSKGLARHPVADRTVVEITQEGADLVEDLISKTEARSNGYSDTRVINLAFKLKNIYPKGKKPGSNYYWTESTQLIARRLRIFFKKYGSHYTEEDILDATTRYVKSFEGAVSGQKYMKLLKYFIFKEGTGVGGDVEPSSDLLDYIENKEQDNAPKPDGDWLSDFK